MIVNTITSLSSVHIFLLYGYFTRMNHMLIPNLNNNRAISASNIFNVCVIQPALSAGLLNYPVALQRDQLWLEISGGAVHMCCRSAKVFSKRLLCSGLTRWWYSRARYGISFTWNDSKLHVSKRSWIRFGALFRPSKIFASEYESCPIFSLKLTSCWKQISAMTVYFLFCNTQYSAHWVRH